MITNKERFSFHHPAVLVSCRADDVLASCIDTFSQNRLSQSQARPGRSTQCLQLLIVGQFVNSRKEKVLFKLELSMLILFFVIMSYYHILYCLKNG